MTIHLKILCTRGVLQDIPNAKSRDTEYPELFTNYFVSERQIPWQTDMLEKMYGIV